MHRSTIVPLILVLGLIGYLGWQAVKPEKMTYYRQGELTLVAYGKKTAMKHMVVNNEPSAYGFHEFRRLSDDRYVGTIGAAEYLLENGNPISCGYAQIEPDGRGGYNASYGAMRFRLNKDGSLDIGDIYGPPSPCPDRPYRRSASFYMRSLCSEKKI